MRNTRIALASQRFATGHQKNRRTHYKLPSRCEHIFFAFDSEKSNKYLTPPKLFSDEECTLHTGSIRVILFRYINRFYTVLCDICVHKSSVHLEWYFFWKVGNIQPMIEPVVSCSDSLGITVVIRQNIPGEQCRLSKYVITYVHTELFVNINFASLAQRITWIRSENKNCLQ